MSRLSQEALCRWVRLDLTVPGVVNIEDDNGKVHLSIPVVFRPSITGPATFGVNPEGMPLDPVVYEVRKRTPRYYTLVYRDLDGGLISVAQHLGFHHRGSIITVMPAPSREGSCTTTTTSVR